MILASDIADIPLNLPAPRGLTIGNYDGLHKGHLFLLQKLRDKIGKQGTLAVFTFGNHPSTVIATRAAAPLICTPAHKLLLLEQLGVDVAIVQAFSYEFSQIPFDSFLRKLKDRFPFSDLVLGVGSSFGQDRKGEEPQVKKLSQELHFSAEYLEKMRVEDYVVSSGLVRNFITKGDFARIELCLGRPYSIYNTLLKNPKKPHELVLSLEGLCLLPEKDYTVRLKSPQRTVEGKATISRHLKQLLLHLPSLPSSLIGSMVEVVFIK